MTPRQSHKPYDDSEFGNPEYQRRFKRQRGKRFRQRCKHDLRKEANSQ